MQRYIINGGIDDSRREDSDNDGGDSEIDDGFSDDIDSDGNASNIYICRYESPT